MSRVLNLQNGQRINVVAAYGEVIYSGTFIRVDPDDDTIAFVEIEGREAQIPIADLQHVVA